MNFIKALKSFPYWSHTSSPALATPMRGIGELDPTTILPGGVRVRNNHFSGHLKRSPPSSSPGIDIDVEYDTEKLPMSQKPTVHSPVSGIIKLVGGNWGTLIIEDRNGYLHKLLHNELENLGPIDSIFPLKVDDNIALGDPFGFLGRIKADKDHVHYSIYDPVAKTYMDPDSVWRDFDGTILGPKDYDKYFYDVLQQEYNKQPRIKRYDQTRPNHFTDYI